MIAEAQITKSGFFRHLKDKNALARALLKRHLEEEERGVLDDVFARARELHEDPLHAFLISLKLLAEMMSDLPSGHPGCLVALADMVSRSVEGGIVLSQGAAAARTAGRADRAAAFLRTAAVPARSPDRNQ